MPHIEIVGSLADIFGTVCNIRHLQVKIMKNPDLLHTASEQFLGKKEHEIKSTVLQTLEGHLRAILGIYIYVR